MHFSQASLMLSKLPSETVGEPLERNRLCDAVNVLLSLQVSYRPHKIPDRLKLKLLLLRFMWYLFYLYFTSLKYMHVERQWWLCII